ncbi:hypothetical protein JW911_02500 [Candidatus Peregrinibacteria bacterium]|nr:hypothetical protein [Candidatus Peregrinibacteria bacterium]
MKNESIITDPNLTIIELLKKNNELLEQMLKLQKKEHRAHIWGTVIHVFLTLLPLLLAIGITYYLFTLVNNNIMALKGNVDALKDFIVKLIPDFSGMGQSLNNVWQDVQFWN